MTLQQKRLKSPIRWLHTSVGTKKSLKIMSNGWRTRPCSYSVGSRYYDISGRTCQCPKDTNCQKSQKAVWRYEFKEVLLEALLLVRQLFYLIREWKQSESYPTIYQKSRNKIKSGSVRTHSPTPMRCSCSYGRGTLLSFYRTFSADLKTRFVIFIWVIKRIFLIRIIHFFQWFFCPFFLSFFP